MESIGLRAKRFLENRVEPVCNALEREGERKLGSQTLRKAKGRDKKNMDLNNIFLNFN